MTFNDVFPLIPGPLRPTDVIFIKLNFMKVEDISKYQVSKFVFKNLNQTSPLQFHNWFKLNHEKYMHRTRSNFNTTDGTIIKNMFITSARTANYGFKQLRVIGPMIWNALSSYLKNENSLYVFMKNLKLYLILRYL